MEAVDALPGSELVTKGLSDLARRDATAEAFLVSIAAGRLAASGHAVAEPFADPELRLYALLVEDDVDAAYSRYNALLRKLSSYARAAECVVP